MLNKRLKSIIIILFMIIGPVKAQNLEGIPSHALIKELNCQACHSCVNPSLADPCLRFGPHLFFEHGKKLMPEQLPPELVIINNIEEKYESVHFKHRKHMHMAQRMEDCAECHHYWPPDLPKQKCRTCHNPNTVRHDLDMISLNGAYHRKCLGCHVEWGKSTNCEVCHASKNKEHSEKMAKALSKFRVMERPNFKLYLTLYFTGPVVNFNHQKHADMTNVACADCHVKQPCTTCHYQGERPATMNPLAREGVHGTCRLCHDVMTQGTCEKCHKESVPDRLVTTTTE